MAKNKDDWKSRLGMVFSTNENFDYQYDNEETETLLPNKQQLEAKLEKKGRGGKTVCLIEGFVGSEDDLKELAKELKNKCGVGGSTKEGVIIIQGDFRDKIILILKEKGYKVKRVGG